MLCTEPETDLPKKIPLSALPPVTMPEPSAAGQTAVPHRSGEGQSWEGGFDEPSPFGAAGGLQQLVGGLGRPVTPQAADTASVVRACILLNSSMQFARQSSTKRGLQMQSQKYARHILEVASSSVASTDVVMEEWERSDTPSMIVGMPSYMRDKPEIKSCTLVEHAWRAA